MNGALLAADGLTRRFSGIVAVDDVSIAVDEGQLAAIIGPNGAGKSTLFQLIGGQLRADAGRVRFANQDVTGLASDRRARLGIGIAFQQVRLFGGMTVLENVMVGAHSWTRCGLAESVLRLPRQRREEHAIVAEAEHALARVGLYDLKDRLAETLPIGQQRGVQIARALCGRPRLLLLDEPASGLETAERDHLAGVLDTLRQDGLAMLLIVHDVAFVSRLASQVIVLDRGRVIAAGTPDAVRRDARVIDAYLGGTDLNTQRPIRPPRATAERPNERPLLQVTDLVVRYGAATALDGVSLEVYPGEMVALIGANGAGKTTLLNTLCGLQPWVSGSFHIDGRIAQAPEGRQIFPGMTVDANLRLGGWTRGNRDPASAYTLFPQLAPLRQRKAGTLSGGEQQMVAVGRALMAEPDLLAVDELSLGLAPTVVDTLAEHIVRLNRERGMSVLLVEQSERLALSLCDRAYVLQSGRIVASGPASQLADSGRIRAAYFGAPSTVAA